MTDRRQGALVQTTERLGLPTRRSRKPARHIQLRHAAAAAQSIYQSDHVEGRALSRLKWFISTCLAGAVGATAIALAIYGSLEDPDDAGMLASLERMGREALKPGPHPKGGAKQGLRVAGKKSDMIQGTSRGLLARYDIRVHSRKRLDGDEFVVVEPYVRIVAQLATKPPKESDLIPPFNPFKLYGDTKPIGQSGPGGDARDASGGVLIRTLEPADGLLPLEDGQELGLDEVAEIVALAGEEYDGPIGAANGALDKGDGRTLSSGTDAVASLGRSEEVAQVENTTELVKTRIEAGRDDTVEGLESQIVKVARGDTLMRILGRLGVEKWQARLVAEAAAPVLSKAPLKVGEELHLTLAPSPTRSDAMDPVRVSLFGTGHQHRFTLVRDETGRFVRRAKPLLALASAPHSSGGSLRRSTLYESIYQAALMQNIPPERIMHVLRIHAYDTDFKRRVSPGDGMELFFALEKDEGNGRERLGELLMTALTVGGETRRFYRFRTPDGVVDYYDENGNNAKKFLMRKPVKGQGVRLTSTFGMRWHPLLRRRKMHFGIDWAAKPGTRVLAAGSGTIEFAGRKGGYGNFVRIRHRNGYTTTYAHMLRLAQGAKAGVKVRQGQVIGYVGSTGLSSGPHLHFEVLVNNRPANPLKIHVPRERQLRGKLLAEFQKERARIEELMALPPVKTHFAQATRR